MDLARVLESFDELLARVRQPDLPRTYSHARRNDTVGLCAERAGADLATIARFLAGLIPDGCPPDLVEPMAMILLLDQSARHLRHAVLAVDVGTVFAPTIAYVALHSRARIHFDVRYIDHLGADRQPTSAPGLDAGIDVLLAFGRTASLKPYLRARAWPPNGAILRLDPAGATVTPLGPSGTRAIAPLLGDARWAADIWGQRLA